MEDGYFEDGTLGDSLSDDGVPVLAFSDGDVDDPMDSIGDTAQTESSIYADWYPLLSDSQLSISNIDTNLSALADYLMQKFGPLEASPDVVDLEDPGVDALMSSAGSETDETIVPEGDIDIYAQKLDAIIELQTVINDNLVRSYSNTNLTLNVLVLVVGFLAGSLFVSFLLSRIKV